MNPIELLFKLLYRFVWQGDDNEYAKTKEQANEWWRSIVTDDEAMAKATGKDLMFIRFKKWSSQWYGKVVFAILYLWGVKQVHLWMTDEGEDDRETMD
ncbi:MAG: hypothetical protein E6R08_02890 [Nevskiaceae bacterium]|nr:MAG: hypothetical protein E6R08_02890 [Nevskiaceae bacterium]